MLLVSCKDRWRGGIWKGCRSGLVQFNVTSGYKAKLCYMSLYHPGLTLLGGLRGKPSITNPVCTFWITWPFLSFFWWTFLWTWVLSRRHLARCLNSCLVALLSCGALRFPGAKSTNPVGSSCPYCTSLGTWNMAERPPMSHQQNSSGHNPK